MKKIVLRHFAAAMTCTGLVAGGMLANADNPIIKHDRTADPSAHVWPDGKMWIYTSHDQDDASGYDSMDGYRAYSSTDMIHWEDHGEVLHSRDVPWGADGLMWAPTAIHRHGKYYLIYPHSKDGSRDMNCGIAVSDVPEGPFKDIGYIDGVEGRWLDPMVFTDTDDSVYLYWGVGEPKVAKLTDDLTELAEQPRTIQYGSDDFFEASHMHLRDGKYYFSYNAGVGGYYAVGDSPYGPFVYQGAINPAQIQDHHSIVNYKGQDYFFYHWQFWNKGTGHRRNTALEFLHYNRDGTMQIVYPSPNGVDYRNIYDGVKAVNFHAASGVEKDAEDSRFTGNFVTGIEQGDFLEYKILVEVPGKYTMKTRVGAFDKTVQYDVLLNGEKLDSVDHTAAERGRWFTIERVVPLEKGSHTLRLEATGPSAWKLNTVDFTPVEP